MREREREREKERESEWVIISESVSQFAFVISEPL